MARHGNRKYIDFEHLVRRKADLSGHVNGLVQSRSKYDHNLLGRLFNNFESTRKDKKLNISSRFKMKAHREKYI